MTHLKGKSRKQCGAIDYEIPWLKEIFDALDIRLESFHLMMWTMPPWAAGYMQDRRGQFSVKTVVNRLEPRRVIKQKAKVDGAKSVRIFWSN